MGWRIANRRRLLVWLLRGVAGVVSLPLLYLLAALLLGAVPANVAFNPAGEDGVTVYVLSNGVHTWIVMPKVNADMDWRLYAQPQHLSDPRWGNADHVAIGYGNRDFYLNTPTWGDLTVRRAFAAFFGGGPSLLHVIHIDHPRPGPDQRPIRISHAQYRRLAGFIQNRFRMDAGGRPIPLIGRGYGPDDMFYEANGGYSFILTCNEWTGRALREAGVRVGLWTPFNQSIMWRLD
jgi:uncharacterized protein (TIGR02117 family)